MHGTVAAAVAERQHGLFANLLTDLAHLVGLQILDDEAVRAYQILILAHGVVDTDVIALLVGAEAYIHANDAVGLDTQRFD